MDSGKPATSAAITAAEAYFGTPVERHAKGSGLDIIAAERDLVVAKSAKLKAARQAQEVVQAGIDAETRRNAPAKKTVVQKKKSIARNDDDASSLAV